MDANGRRAPGPMRVRRQCQVRFRFSLLGAGGSRAGIEWIGVLLGEIHFCLKAHQLNRCLWLTTNCRGTKKAASQMSWNAAIMRFQSSRVCKHQFMGVDQT